MKAKGSSLRPAVQAQCLAMYVHRFTGDHRPKWADEPREDGTAYKVQFKDDKDWLEHTDFYVTESGELDKKQEYCESHPTWPEESQ